MNPLTTKPRASVLLGRYLNADHKTLISLAQLAEELGYHDFWYGDERFYREAYVGLTACAMSTSHMRLGPAVTDPYTRHPALTAASMASLDELSGGRAMLGYGAGLSGFHNLGIKPDRPALALREGIQIIRRLWAGEKVTYEGQVISIWDGNLRFPARPDLPIYVAADGPFTLRLAGELADGVIIPHCASPLIFKPKLEQVKRGQDKARRVNRPEVVARLDVTVSNDHDAALHQAKIRLGRRLWDQYPNIEYLAAHCLALPPELDRRLREAGPFQRTHDLSVFARFADSIPDDFVFPISLAGTPREVAEQARSVLSSGVDQIMAYLLVPQGETIQGVLSLYAAQVIPRL